jgi:long-subunit fatty acid transport protein
VRKGLLAVLLLALSLGAARPAAAVNSMAGTSAAQFLKLGAGSRAGAMAEAYSAVADDVYAVYYNPGALTNLTKPELAAAHTQHFQGISYEFASFAYPLSRELDYSRHVLGAAIYNLSVADIERRTDDTQTNLGTFGAGDYAYNFTYAYRPERRLGLGVTGKIISQSIDSYSSTAFAVDAGAHYRMNPEAERPVALALVIKNVGTRPSFAGVSDPLPVGVVVGVGYKPVKNFKLDLDLTKYRDTDLFGALGGEYQHSFDEGLSGALRFGYTTHRKDNEGLNGLTLGVGGRLNKVSFDFAWVPYGVLGDTFRYSIHLKF